jgi:biotin transporter BioY
MTQRLADQIRQGVFAELHAAIIWGQISNLSPVPFGLQSFSFCI